MKSKVRYIVLSLTVLLAATGQVYAADALQQAQDLVRVGLTDGKSAPTSSTVFDGARHR